MEKNKKGLQWWNEQAAPEMDGQSTEKLWDLTGRYKANYQPDAKLAYEKFRQRLVDEPTAVPMLRRRLWWRIAAAAVVLLGSLLVWRLYVQPADAPLRTATTDANSTLLVQLSDGTTIRLNRNSQLVYPENFQGTLRSVKLSGEAFFQVAADAQRPFLIETTLGQVRVLGTTFNVRAFPEESTLEVYVQEGRVRVTPTGGQPHELSAGQSLRYDKNAASVQMSLRGDANALAWMTGQLSFQNAPLSKIAQALERHYRVAIEIENSALADCKLYFNVQVGRLQDAWDVLEHLCESIDVKPVGKDRFRISGQCCQ